MNVSFFKILTGIRIGERSLGRPRRRWEDHIRESIREIRMNKRNLVDLARGKDYWRAIVNVILHLQV